MSTPFLHTRELSRDPLTKLSHALSNYTISYRRGILGIIDVQTLKEVSGQLKEIIRTIHLGNHYLPRDYLDQLDQIRSSCEEIAWNYSQWGIPGVDIDRVPGWIVRFMGERV
jgi:hypothetical protein